MFAPVLLDFAPCLISVSKQTHAAEPFQTHITEKGMEQPAITKHTHTHTHTKGHTECESIAQPDLELTRRDDVNRGLVGMLSD